MDKPQGFYGMTTGETLLERAVRRELKRIDKVRSVSSAHHTAGTVPLPAPEPSLRRRAPSPAA